MKNYRIYINYTQHNKDGAYFTEKEFTIEEIAKSEYSAYKLGLERLFTEDLERGNLARDININITKINN